MPTRHEARVQAVLIADDDAALVSGLCTGLRGYGIAAHPAASRDEAIEVATRYRPEAALVDLQLGCDNGLDLLRDLHAGDPVMKLFLITGHGTVRSAVEAMQIGAIDVVEKPFGLGEIAWRLAVRRTRLDGSLSRLTALHVRRVLADWRDNRSEAARRLGVTRSWLVRFLSQPLRTS